MRERERGRERGGRERGGGERGGERERGGGRERERGRCGYKVYPFDSWSKLRSCTTVLLSCNRIQMLYTSK